LKAPVLALTRFNTIAKMVHTMIASCITSNKRKPIIMCAPCLTIHVYMDVKKYEETTVGNDTAKVKIVGLRL
jgi:hypothetical protein